MKRCGPLIIKLGRRSPSDQGSVELITPVSGVEDAVQSSASSTIALSFTSPPGSISTSFFTIRSEPQQTEPLFSSTPVTLFALPLYSPSALPSPILSPIYSVPAPLHQLRAVTFLPAPPTPSTAGTYNSTSSGRFHPTITTVLQHEVSASPAETDPTGTGDATTFCGTAATFDRLND